MRLTVHPPLRLGTCARSRLRIRAAPSSREHSHARTAALCSRAALAHSAHSYTLFYVRGAAPLVSQLLPDRFLTCAELERAVAVARIAHARTTLRFRSALACLLADVGHN